MGIHATRRLKWDARFLSLAAHIADWSKDPSTRCGAVIVDPDRQIVSVGYNGFARGVEDTPERLAVREVKYRLVVHAERNALLFAGRKLTGCTLYTHPFGTCASCAAMVIQSGISRVVSRFSDNPRWLEEWRHAAAQYAEAGVAWDVYPDGGPGPVGFTARGHVVYPSSPEAIGPLVEVRKELSMVIPGHGKSEL